MAGNNELSFLSNIPLDVTRLIFEKAMEDRPMPLHLALVSRQVQHWVEPLIYRHLTFRTNYQFELFYRTFRNRRSSLSKHPEFFSRNVKTLHVLSRSFPRREKLIAVGSGLTGLVAVAGWDNSWGRTVLEFLRHRGEANDVSKYFLSDDGTRQRDGFQGNLSLSYSGRATSTHADSDVDTRRDTYPYQDLRRISVAAAALLFEGMDLTHRLFRHITHLDIYFNRDFDWSTLASLYCLAYLSVDLITLVRPPRLSTRNLELWIDNILQHCQDLKNLKAIILTCVDMTNANFDLMDNEEHYLFPSLLPEEKEGPWFPTDLEPPDLHYLTRLSIGSIDPRIVLGTLTERIPKSHLFREYMIDFLWPKNAYDWDFTMPLCGIKESWDMAEDIIKSRKKAEVSFQRLARDKWEEWQ